MSKYNLNPLDGNDIHRLSDSTRALAARYLAGDYQSRLRSCGFSSAELNLPSPCPPEIRHGKMALLTAERSRIEILPEELLAGSAPNIEAAHHDIPGLLDGNGKLYRSISHTTVDFPDAMRKGLAGLEKEVRGFLDSDNDQHHRDFYNGLLDVISAMRLWTQRHIDAYQTLLKTSEGQAHADNIRAIIARLQRVPELPPQSFAEAVQSLWSFFEFQRLCGNWSGLGRIDEFLWPYLQADLAAGKITLDEAREFIAHFWIKGTEWCFGLRANTAWQPGDGDAQNYQNIILSGIDADGKQIENEVTFLVLDVVEELHISDYPVTVRLNANTSDKLLRRIANVQFLGGGIVSIYNEPLILEGLAKLGYDDIEARRFTNDGCWEIIIPGQTNFGYLPQDMLQPFQEALFAEKTPESYDELYHNFLTRWDALLDEVRHQLATVYALPGKKTPADYPTASTRQASLEHCDVVLSLLEPSCRANGCSYTYHGTKYYVRAIHMAGLPDVANSLYAIKKMVFEQHRVTLPQLVSVLRENWEGHEELQHEFANSLSYYGNDNPEADEILRQALNDCADRIAQVPKIAEILIPAGVSTFGREIYFAPKRLATAFGRKAHEYLAPNLGPTPGTDKNPLTAVINSYCRMDFTKVPNGCPLDLRLSANFRKIPDAAEILSNILKVFIMKRGFYLQIDTVDPEMLRAAQREPDRYPNLVVRISGWSARFASLNAEWQELMIQRTALEQC